MKTLVRMKELPVCNWCGRPANYDFRTQAGPWAYGCERHWRVFRLYTELGEGMGQELKLEDKNVG
jgi:hypothetical protein